MEAQVDEPHRALHEAQRRGQDRLGVGDGGEDAPMVRFVAVYVEEPDAAIGGECARKLADFLDGATLADVRYELDEFHITLSTGWKDGDDTLPLAAHWQYIFSRRPEEELDRKETEFRRGDAEANPSVTVSEPGSGDLASRIAELKRQGQDLYSEGRYDEAIHVWTRILFFDRGNLEARRAIETARRDVAERQRRLDLEIGEADRRFVSGDVDGARELVRSVLAADASHTEAVALSAKLSALERRVEPTRESHSSPPVAEERANSRGIVLRVPKGQPAGVAPGSPAASRLSMTAFVLGAVVVFAASALYLSENWDSLVSGGGFGQSSGGSAVPAVDSNDLPVPGLPDLHYFNGVRLFEQERYREALGELSRVDRSSPFDAEARSLIVRIEERLLRGGSEPLPGATSGGNE
jgi:tetratricopeptide (TPR) repeat protein